MNLLLAVALMVAAFVVGVAVGRARGAPSSPPLPRAAADAATVARVRSLLASDGKIAAIKAYREATGAGLKESKEAVDAMEPGGR